MAASGMNEEDEPHDAPIETPEPACDDDSDSGDERTDEDLKAYIDECIRQLLIGFIDN